MTTVRIHSIKEVTGVPNITFVDKGQDLVSPSGEHAIVLDPTKVTHSLRREGNIEVPIPVTRNDWGDKRSFIDDSPWTVRDFHFPTQTQNSPERRVADFTRVNHTFQVEGFINRFSSKELPTTEAEIDDDWNDHPSPYDTVFQVRDELKDMFEFGGPVVFEYGTQKDGFNILNPPGYRYKVLIESLQFEEDPQGPGKGSAADADTTLHQVPQVLRVIMTLKVMTEI